jgi:ribosome-associated protein
MTHQVALQPVEYAHAIVDGASELQAYDVVLLDVRQACDFADYYVILSAQSPRQIRSLIEEIESLMIAQDVRLHHIEGTHDSGWVLMDFGDVIVHILAPEEREFYDLERVWPRAIELVRLQ